MPVDLLVSFARSIQQALQIWQLNNHLLEAAPELEAAAELELGLDELDAAAVPNKN